MDEWYSYKGFNFNKEQVLWAIGNLETLRNGLWPAEPKETGYTEAIGIRKSKQTEATFVKPIGIAGELDWRLKRTKTDGKLLEAEVRASEHLKFWTPLSDEAKMALNYISGWRRKTLPYYQYKRQRIYRLRKQGYKR